MKFFHLSDLHIGLKLYNKDMSEDQIEILRQVVKYAKEEKPDALVIAGDIYDKAIPSAEAVGIFDRFVEELTREAGDTTIMMISGNHDNAQRLNLYRSVLESSKIHMIGLAPQSEEEGIKKVTLEDSYGKVNFYLLPFVKPSMVKAVIGVDQNGNQFSYDETLHRLIEREVMDETQRNVLVSHQFYIPSGKKAEEMERMDSEVRTIGNIDEVKADILERFDYAALGHIHKPMTLGNERMRYCGTPYCCSVSEAAQKKGIVVVELKEKEEIQIRVLPLKPLREVRVIRGTLKEVLQMGCQDYVSVVLTDQEDLDVFDMQDRLRMEFPNLLEIRRENVKTGDYSFAFSEEKELNMYELCTSFLKDLDDEEEELLKDVIQTVQGV